MATGARRHTAHCKPVLFSHQTFERIQSVLFTLHRTFLIDREILASYIMKVLLFLLLCVFLLLSCTALLAFVLYNTFWCLRLRPRNVGKPLNNSAVGSLL